MNGTSIFTERLQQLTRYSAKIDRATIKENDFVALQQLSEKIMEEYNHGYYDLQRRQILRNTALYLIDAARETLRINKEIQRISREIEKARRAERRTA